MMFILNFDYVLEEDSSDSLERLNLTPPPKSDYSKSNVLHHLTMLIKLYFPLLIIFLCLCCLAGCFRIVHQCMGPSKPKISKLI